MTDEVTDNWARLLGAARLKAGNPTAQAVFDGMGQTVSHGTVARALRGASSSRHTVDLVAAYLIEAGTPGHNAIMDAYDREQINHQLPLGFTATQRNKSPSKLPVNVYRNEIAAAIRDTGNDLGEAIRYLADTIRDGKEQPDG